MGRSKATSIRPTASVVIVPSAQTSGAGRTNVTVRGPGTNPIRW